MPENFSIHNSAEDSETIKFQEDSLGLVKLDGTLSAVEINELNEKFSDNCTSVKDETGGKLGDFLRSDVIPNFNKSVDGKSINPYVKERINFLSLTHPETIQAPSLTPEIQKYFQINASENPELSDNLGQLSKLGLDLNQFLGGLQDHIDGELNFLSSDAKEKICKSIGLKTLSLSNTLSDMDLEDFSGEELLNQRWIVNSKIQDVYSFYTESLFPSLQVQNAINSGYQVSSSYTDEQETRTLESGTTYQANNQRYIDVEMHMEEIDELLNASIDDDGNFDEGFFSTQDLFQSSNERDAALLEDMGIKIVDDISLLNEKDKQSESIASLGEMCLVGISCLPYIGAIPSIMMDVNDLLGRQPAAINALKSGGLIDTGYKIETSWLDTVASGASLLLTPTGMQGFAKAGKLAKAASKIDNLNPQIIDQTIDVITQKLGFGDRIKEKLKSVLGFRGDINTGGVNSNFGENRADLDFMARAEKNGMLSDDIGTHNYNIQGETIKVSEREQAFLMRLQEGFDNGETKLDINLLEKENISVLLGILKNMHLEHGDIPVGQHTSSQIADKLRIARNAGMDRDIYRLTVREGFAGISTVSVNHFEVNPYTLSTISKHSPEVTELINTLHNSGGDIGEALTKIDFEKEGNIKAIELAITGIDGLISRDDIQKIEAFLSFRGKNLPEGLNMNDLREMGDTGITEIFLQNLFLTLREVKTGMRHVNNIDESPDLFNMPDSDFLNAIRKNLDEISPDFDFNLKIQKSSLEMRSLLGFYNGVLDKHTMMLCKNIFTKEGLEIAKLRHTLLALTGDRRNVSRLFGSMSKYNKNASDSFVQHFHTGGDTNLSMNEINSFFAANPDIKVLNVSSLHFDEVDERGANLYRSLIELSQREGTDVFISPSMPQDYTMRSAV